MNRINRRCTTHHHACDCRERKFAAMEKALRDIVKHHEIIGGSISKLTTTVKIAQKALDFDGSEK